MLSDATKRKVNLIAGGVLLLFFIVTLVFAVSGSVAAFVGLAWGLGSLIGVGSVYWLAKKKSFRLGVAALVW